MSSLPVVSVEGLGKVYRRYATPQKRLYELLGKADKQYASENWALKDIALSLAPGDRLGIVGDNGSGKSTLLKILAGVLSPTLGQVNVRGRISALLELGAGFNADLSGIENIRQFCVFHGMSKAAINDVEQQVMAFSELGDALYHPVRTYSSGMAVRLGFACAVHVEPDILIIDEALSVGDSYFQNKCLHKIKQLLDQGVTFIYVTHGADAVRRLCNKAIWLDQGQLLMQGEAAAVAEAYQSAVFERSQQAGLAAIPEELGDKIADNDQSLSTMSSATRGLMARPLPQVEAFSQRVASLRNGSGEVLVEDIVLIDSAGNESNCVLFEEVVRLRLFYRCVCPHDFIASLTLGITDRHGQQLVHFNSGTSSIFASSDKDVPQMVEFSFKNMLCPGEYGVVAGISVLSQHPSHPGLTVIDRVLDYCPGGTRFNVRAQSQLEGRDLWGLVAFDYETELYRLD